MDKVYFKTSMEWGKYSLTYYGHYYNPLKIHFSYHDFITVQLSSTIILSVPLLKISFSLYKIPEILSFDIKLNC